MSTLSLLEELARDVGWGGGLLYLVDLGGGALARWRRQNDFDRRMREADRYLVRPIDGVAPPAAAPVPSAGFPPEEPTRGRGRAPR